MNPKHKLEALIQECWLDLETYAARPDAKEGYLQKQNALLLQLVDIYNQLDELYYYDIWVAVEANWQELSQKDANHAGMSVDLRTKPYGPLCYLAIPFYQDGI